MRHTAIALLLLAALAGGAWAQDLDQDPDPTSLIEAPPKFELGEGVKVGYRAERAHELEGSTPLREFVAVVGETDEAWEVETTVDLHRVTFRGIPVARGHVMALVVDKKTHEVLAAKLGKPGAKPKEIKIADGGKWPAWKLLRQEEVRLPSGKKVQAEVWGWRKDLRWLGAKGTELAGVVLGFERGGQGYGLTGDPQAKRFELESTDAKGKALWVPGLHSEYGDGSERITTREPVARALGWTVLLEVRGERSLRVLSLGKDAKKTLDWK